FLQMSMQWMPKKLREAKTDWLQPTAETVVKLVK
ncbi:hypothetical protein Q604_UNBC07747G0001, partial [human gut metagenome]